MDRDKFFGVPKSLIKIVLGCVCIIAILGFLNPDIDCWFSINSSCPDYPSLAMLLGVLTAVSFMAVLQVPVIPATIAGVLVWVMFYSFL
jgi:hypothetical protein